MTLATSRAAARGMKRRITSASATGSPSTLAVTRRALRAVMRTHLAVATTSISLLLQRRAAFGVVAMTAVAAGGGELAELVAHHRLGDEHGDVLAAVVHRDGVSHHVGEHVAATRPRLDDPLLAAGVELLHLLEQMVIAERTFLQGTAHLSTSSVAARSCDRSTCSGGSD